MARAGAGPSCSCSLPALEPYFSMAGWMPISWTIAAAVSVKSSRAGRLSASPMVRARLATFTKCWMRLGSPASNLTILSISRLSSMFCSEVSCVSLSLSSCIVFLSPVIRGVYCSAGTRPRPSPPRLYCMSCGLQTGPDGPTSCPQSRGTPGQSDHVVAPFERVTSITVPFSELVSTSAVPP